MGIFKTIYNTLKPGLWPVAHCAEVIFHKGDFPEPEKSIAKPYYNFLEIMAATFLVIPELGICLLAVYFNTFNIEECKEYEKSWILKVIIRDFIIVISVAGFWDWFLYFSPWAKKIKNLKFNEEIPEMS